MGFSTSMPASSASSSRTGQATPGRSCARGGGGGREGKLPFKIYNLGCNLGACMSIDESRDHLINLQGWPKDAPPFTFPEADLEVGERGEEDWGCEQGVGGFGNLGWQR